MMLEKIDFWFLGWLEKFAHWWQKLTGKNCFWLSRVFIILGAINLIGLYQLDILKGRQLTIPILVICIVLAGVIGMWHQSKRNEKKVLCMSEQSCANPLKISNFSFRMMWLSIAMLAIITSSLLLLHPHSFPVLEVFFSLSYALSWGLYEYFQACDPLPPAKSKIKEWKEKFANAVKGVFVPAPQSSPAPCE